ncbi:nucleoside hydrolase [Paenibacillus sp. FSL R10-2748]|uniref:nucleoside hydrolase n=1 Tax=Paenibacillus sp. FSL R10-2748 TaxID=2954658 RepID=UPI0030F4E1E4
MLTHPFEVPESKKIRLIINTDAKNEADDQYAIVHALLTPRFNLKGIIAAHFGERRTTASMQESYDEIINLLDLMNMNDEVPVFKGTERSIPNENTPTMSEGAELIIREAMLDDRQPLYVIFLGAITDLASAYLACPEIAGRFTAVWICTVTTSLPLLSPDNIRFFLYLGQTCCHYIATTSLPLSRRMTTSLPLSRSL